MDLRSPCRIRKFDLVDFLDHLVWKSRVPDEVDDVCQAMSHQIAVVIVCNRMPGVSLSDHEPVEEMLAVVGGNAVKGKFAANCFAHLVEGWGSAPSVAVAAYDEMHVLVWLDNVCELLHDLLVVRDFVDPAMLVVHHIVQRPYNYNAVVCRCSSGTNGLDELLCLCADLAYYLVPLIVPEKVSEISLASAPTFGFLQLQRTVANNECGKFAAGLDARIVEVRKGHDSFCAPVDLSLVRNHQCLEMYFGDAAVESGVAHRNHRNVVEVLRCADADAPQTHLFCRAEDAESGVRGLEEKLLPFGCCKGSHR